MMNFQNQVKQRVGSIQQSNDLDVHIALAPSYAKEYMEKYSSLDKTPYQICREYVDLFGMLQKNPNALAILIEEAKIQLLLWGSPEPNFLLCNSKLTFRDTRRHQLRDTGTSHHVRDSSRTYRPHLHPQTILLHNNLPQTILHS
jgi:hypothetical protein